MHSHSRPSFSCPAFVFPLVSSISALLLLSGAILSAHLPDGSGAGPLYTVAALRAHLARDPAAWLHRPLRVRGFLDGCPHPVCPGHEPNFSPPLLMDLSQPAYPLPVAWASPDPVSAFLRRLPVVGTLVPAPQVPRWGAVATYRVRLGAPAAGACPAPPCYEALVLDTAPGVQGG